MSSLTGATGAMTCFPRQGNVVFLIVQVDEEGRTCTEVTSEFTPHKAKSIACDLIRAAQIAEREMPEL
jgi:hypothetical protein